MGKNASTPLTKQDINRIETYAGIGLSWVQIAACFDLHVNTLDKMRKRQPEINVAFDRGRPKMSARLRGVAYQLATQDKNPRMIEFLLKTREGFRETQVVEHIVADQSSATFKAIPRHERIDAIERLIAIFNKCKNSAKVES